MYFCYLPPPAQLAWVFGQQSSNCNSFFFFGLLQASSCQSWPSVQRAASVQLFFIATVRRAQQQVQGVKYDCLAARGWEEDALRKTACLPPLLFLFLANATCRFHLPRWLFLCIETCLLCSLSSLVTCCCCCCYYCLQLLILLLLLLLLLLAVFGLINLTTTNWIEFYEIYGYWADHTLKRGFFLFS